VAGDGCYAMYRETDRLRINKLRGWLGSAHRPCFLYTAIVLPIAPPVLPIALITAKTGQTFVTIRHRPGRVAG